MDEAGKRLVLFAEIAAQAKGAKSREAAVKKLCKVARKIVTPKFVDRKLRDALNSACIEKPDFGDPVVFESNKGKVVIHLNGSFDLDKLSEQYFKEDREMIDAV